MTLITTNFHRNDRETEIEIWDLGLRSEQLRLLSLPNKQNIKLRWISELGRPPFKGAFDASKKSFSWKPLIIQESLQDTDCLLWLDAGVAVANDLELIFDNVTANQFLFYKNNDYINLDYSSDQCLTATNTTEEDWFSPQIHGNVLAFQRNNSSLSLVDRWCSLMKKKEIATSEFVAHRHDQSILSLLISQRNLPVLDPKGVINESANFQNAVDQGDLLLAHRRKFNWIDYNSLLNL